MKSEYRVLVFTLTLLVAVPALYALGDWWGGTPYAVLLPSAATLASFLYVRGGDRKPPGGPPTLPPAGMQPPGGVQRS